MASMDDYPPWTSGPPQKERKKWWRKAKKVFLQPWRKSHSTSVMQTGKQKKVKVRKRSQQSGYDPKSQEEQYGVRIPLFRPLISHFSPRPQNSESSSSFSSDSLSLNFDPPPYKPPRPSLSNVFPIYESPQVVSSKPVPKYKPLMTEQRFVPPIPETFEPQFPGSKFESRFPELRLHSKLSQRPEPAHEDVSKFEPAKEAVSQFEPHFPLSRFEPHFTPASFEPHFTPSSFEPHFPPSSFGLTSHDPPTPPRRHSTGSTNIERPQSAQSSDSGERTVDRRRRRISAVRALPVIQKKIGQEPESYGYNPHLMNYPRPPPTSNNYAYRPWPLENETDVFATDAIQKLRLIQEEESTDDDIKGFDEFMMY